MRDQARDPRGGLVDVTNPRVYYRVARSGRYEVGQTYEESQFWARLENEDRQLMREQILEEVREQPEFAMLPSRREAFFAWLTLENAAVWLGEYDHPSEHVIYVVRPLPASIVFVGDYGWLALTARSAEEWEDRAEAYWSGEQRPGVSRWEAVIGGPVAILALVAQGDITRERDHPA